MGWGKGDVEELIESVECPYPADVWTMTDKDYVMAIPDGKLRTAISGFLMRKGWKVFKSQIQKRCREEFE